MRLRHFRGSRFDYASQFLAEHEELLGVYGCDDATSPWDFFAITSQGIWTFEGKRLELALLPTAANVTGDGVLEIAQADGDSLRIPLANTQDIYSVRQCLALLLGQDSLSDESLGLAEDFRWAAGWYLDPVMANTQRYWDGQRWTDHVSPVSSPAPTLSVPAMGSPTGVVLAGVVFAILLPVVGLLIGLTQINRSAGNALGIIALSALSGLGWAALLTAA